MLVIERLAAINAPATERLVLPFDSRCKSRLRTKLQSGEECGLFLDRGTVLRGGDKLEANDGRIVEVVAAPEVLMEAVSGDTMLLIKAAYHLGNRHVALEVKPGRIRFASDHVLGEMVRGLGPKLSEIEAPFEPESGAYGTHGAHGGHGHSGAGDGSPGHPVPKIHDHFNRR